MRITSVLESPSKQGLPVPPPRQENRVIYCPDEDGEYGIRLTPNTADDYSVLALDCPRNGPEGVARVAQLFSPVPPPVP